jgi:predicted methyltransferase
VISNDTKHPISLVKLAHDAVKAQVKSGDIVVDATVGNGHDSHFLLDLIKPDGKVFGFDIQQAALTSTHQLLSAMTYYQCLTLIHDSHANMLEHIPVAYHGKIKVVMFNLGYLPGGDKHIITQADSTLSALNSACELLSSGGIMTVVAYPGHPGGNTETGQVSRWCDKLNKAHYQTKLIVSQADKTSAPVLFVVNKVG